MKQIIASVFLYPCRGYNDFSIYPCRGYNDFSQNFPTQWRSVIYSWSASLDEFWISN